VTDATFDLLSSANLDIILKKTEAEMAVMHAALGEACLQPHRPLGMGGTLTKLAAVCVMGVMEVVAGVAAGFHQFEVNAKGGCLMVQWVLQNIMEIDPDLVRARRDAINALAIWSAHVSVHLCWPTACFNLSSPSTMFSTPGAVENCGKTTSSATLS